MGRDEKLKSLTPRGPAGAVRGDRWAPSHGMGQPSFLAPWERAGVVNGAFWLAERGLHVCPEQKTTFCPRSAARSLQTLFTFWPVFLTGWKPGKIAMKGCWARVFTLLAWTHAEMIENPAIAAKCKKMAQKRVNGRWQSTHFASNCEADSDEEAARLCKKVWRIINYA